jgi:hypothetical protein
MERYSRVPKACRANVIFRRELLRACRTDKGLRRATLELCSVEPLFWINTFCWTYDPRKKASERVVPFITWDYQDEALRKMFAALGTNDIGIEKSRDMGASWLCLLVFMHQWQFVPHSSFMLVSRTEDLVDGSGTGKANDPKERSGSSDSLFWKLDFLLDRQPGFLLPRFRRKHLHLGNLDNGSVIDGAATVGDVGRGGRRTAFLLDEFGAFERLKADEANASTFANTDCRVFNSTYKGRYHTFTDQMKRDDIVKITMPWIKHPDKVQGWKKAGGGRFGWSPWWQIQANRLITPARIASEVDMDPTGADSPFFPADLVDRLLVGCRYPIVQGRLQFEADRPAESTFIECQGPLKLWVHLKPPHHRPEPGEQYVIGADIGSGVGATPSVLSIVEKRTREKIGELLTSQVDPSRFAEYAVALAIWFNNAFLIWESNGMTGQLFGKRVVGLGYRGIYYRREERGLSHKIAEQIIPGWHASPDNKDLVLGAYARALGNNFFVNRSKESIEECRQYVWTDSGHVENESLRGIDDPATGGRNHGDRVIADALANHALGAEPEVKPLPIDDEALIMADPPYMSMAWRRKQWLEKNRQTSDWDSNREATRGWEENFQSLRGWDPETSRNAW